MSESLAIKEPVLVLGVGNILQQDDGVGVHVIEMIRDTVVSSNVAVCDGGTAGLDLISIIDNRRILVVVDAVDGGEEPGTVYRFTPEDIDEPHLRFDSLHQVGLLETLRMAAMTGRGPMRTVIVGVQPEVVDWGMTLSPTVEKQLPRIINQVRKEIELALQECEQTNDTRW